MSLVRSPAGQLTYTGSVAVLRTVSIPNEV
jgi:hypothetical protein